MSTAGGYRSALLLAAILAAGALLPRCAEQPERKVSATVVDIGARDDQYRDSQAVVTIRSQDGLMTVLVVPVASLRCHVGDKVDARERGVSLTVDVEACRR
ncbi:hypothetical protein ACLB0R_00135 [Sphingomonas sp. GlSt437]|uniref:hypothetical protein n=1 Tax=Sphingomonas sp. GlSt437 TaxID=3389970 RepID=UPI003A8A1939